MKSYYELRLTRWVYLAGQIVKQKTGFLMGCMKPEVLFFCSYGFQSWMIIQNYMYISHTRCIFPNICKFDVESLCTQQIDYESKSSTGACCHHHLRITNPCGSQLISNSQNRILMYQLSMLNNSIVHSKSVRLVFIIFYAKLIHMLSLPIPPPNEMLQSVRNLLAFSLSKIPR